MFNVRDSVFHVCLLGPKSLAFTPAPESLGQLELVLGRPGDHSSAQKDAACIGFVQGGSGDQQDLLGLESHPEGFTVVFLALGFWPCGSRPQLTRARKPACLPGTRWIFTLEGVLEERWV